MAMEAFLDSTSEMEIPQVLPANRNGGILQALHSANSRNKEHLDSVLRMAQLNTNLTSDVMLSTFLGKSSGFSLGHGPTVNLANSSLPTGAYLLTPGSTNMETYVCPPSSPVSLDGSSEAEFFSHLCQGDRSRKRQYFERTTASIDLSKSEPQICLNSLPIRIKQETGTLSPFMKKPKLDVNQEIFQQQVIQGLLLKELQDCNPQLKAMIELHRLQNQPQQPILHSVPQQIGLHLQLPKEQMRRCLQDQANEQTSFPPLLDGDICSRRFMQYLYHIRNHPVVSFLIFFGLVLLFTLCLHQHHYVHWTTPPPQQDNNIAYWRNFVSEYYAPCSKKRWCFSMYGNIERHATGVFCPKSMEMWCCELCGSRSGKGLEATFDIFPRLFKIKYESGMLDEILFLDLPVARYTPSGLLVLEYRKAIQENIYEKFRVVHEGKLRVVFRHDLKILSWEFCAQKHEEFLLRRLVAPQVNQFVQGAQKYEYIIRNGLRVTVASEELQTDSDMLVAAGHKLAREMEVPLVNDLGYSKKYIRCLQISEVVNSMKDLISFSHVNNMGPIESLNKYSQPSNIDDRVKEKQEMHQFVVARNLQAFPGRSCPQHLENSFRTTESGRASASRNSVLTSDNLNNQLPGENTFVASASKKQQESRILNHPNPAEHTPYASARSLLSEDSKNPHQALIDKLLQEMVASSRGKCATGTFGKPNKETSVHHYHQNAFGNAFSGCLGNISSKHLGDTSNTGKGNSGNDSKTGNFSKAASQGNLSATTRSIAFKIEPHSSEQVRNLAKGICKVEDLQW